MRELSLCGMMRLLCLLNQGFLPGTYYFRFEDVEEARQVVVLAWHLTEMDDLEVGAHTWPLALSSIYPPPLLLDLHKHGDLTGETR